jgi:hypothetical protein
VLDVADLSDPWPEKAAGLDGGAGAPGVELGNHDVAPRFPHITSLAAVRGMADQHAGHGLGHQDAGLVRPRLLFSAAAFTHRDQPYRLVDLHAAHGSGGVHRPQHDPTTPEQKFCRLDEAAVAIPLGAKHL